MVAERATFWGSGDPASASLSHCRPPGLATPLHNSVEYVRHIPNATLLARKLGVDMAKVIIDARKVIQDLRDGLDDSALMTKHRLSATGLHSVFSKLIEAGLIQKSDLDQRMPYYERTVALTVFNCPACGMPQLSEFDECPQCGIIVSKYQKLKQQPAAEPGKLRYDRPQTSGAPAGQAAPVTAHDDMSLGNRQRSGPYESPAGDVTGELKWVREDLERKREQIKAEITSLVNNLSVKTGNAQPQKKKKLLELESRIENAILQLVDLLKEVDDVREE